MPHHLLSTTSRGMYTSGTEAWLLMTLALVVLPERGRGRQGARFRGVTLFSREKSDYSHPFLTRNTRHRGWQTNIERPGQASLPYVLACQLPQPATGGPPNRTPSPYLSRAGPQTAPRGVCCSERMRGCPQPAGCRPPGGAGGTADSPRSDASEHHSLQGGGRELRGVLDGMVMSFTA